VTACGRGRFAGGGPGIVDVLLIPSPKDRGTAARLAPFIPHAHELARDAEDPISLDLAGLLGRDYSEAGLYQAAREWKEAACHGQVALLGEKHSHTLASMNNLAQTLSAQGNLAGARSLEEEVLEACRLAAGRGAPGHFYERLEPGDDSGRSGRHYRSLPLVEKRSAMDAGSGP